MNNREQFFWSLKKEALVKYLCEASTPFECLIPDGPGKFDFEVDNNGKGHGSYIRMTRGGGSAYVSFEIKDWKDLSNQFKGYTD